MRRTKHLALGLAAVAFLGTPPSPAQLLKVDINTVNQSGSANTAPGFVMWNTIPGNTQISTGTFTNAANQIISCTVSQTVPAFGTSGSVLKANWGNKDGQSKYPLSFDGVWPHNSVSDIPYTNGGAFCLIISNLSAGPHTVTTYHNDVWGTGRGAWHATNALMSGCIISVDGSVITTSRPSYYTTNDALCGYAYFPINVVAGLPVTIGFNPDHTSTNNLDFVVLNGFVIDGLSPGTQATGAIPVDGDEHVFANNDDPLPGTANSGYTTLRWTPSQFAVTNDVYFGADSNAVIAATRLSPEFKGSYTTNFWNTPTNLNSALTYYWRVDSVDSTNGVSKGDLWRFRTRHLAFPGAEGYGRFARGGRGGRVIEVTNTNDSGPGSYRAAIEATGPRTIVFRVSGLIRLNSPCVINSTNGYVTIAGQTAPGEGICLSGWRAGMTSCSDVIMRYLRLRLGDDSHQSMDGIGLGNSNHSIMDHNTISWTIDEATSSRQSGAVGSGSCNITFQRNIISEALDHSYHYDDALRQQTGCTNCFQPHSFAGSISGEIGSYHHNLLAHCTGRNWSMAGGLDPSAHYAGSLDLRNNVVYNWTSRTTDGGVQRANYVNNYYKPYTNASYVVKWLFRLDAINPAWGTESYFIDGNIMEGQNYESNNWQFGTAVFVGNGSTYADSNQLASVRTNAAVFPPHVTTHSARDAFKHVLSDVGCNRPAPDIIDQRVIQETLTKTVHYMGTNTNPYIIDGTIQTNGTYVNRPGIIDKQTDVLDAVGSPNFPWPAYVSATPDDDSDHDGLPDWWELIHGTATNSPAEDFSDSNADPDGDGYTMLEDYLNWLAAPHTTCPVDSFVDIDLGQFTAGFTNAPVHSVFGATNGTVTVTNTIARFTPAATGLAGFSFAVIDAEGSSLTNTVGIRVVAASAPPLTPFEQWQIQYFGSTNNPAADAGADPDGDGQTNLAEFQSGTNPTNSVSALRIISVTRQASDMLITWQTAGGKTNAVQALTGNHYTNDLTDISPAIFISGSGEVTTNYADPGGATNAPARFYRVRLVP
jgi:hypothetical protein